MLIFNFPRVKYSFGKLIKKKAYYYLVEAKSTKMFTTGYHLSKTKTLRSSVVPYVIIEEDKDKKIYFLFAIDKESSDVTDLGGGVKQDEYSLTAAIREFREESDEIFGDLYEDIDKFASCPSIIKDNMCTLFLPVEKKWYDTATSLFKNREICQKRSHDEISELVWFSQEELEEMIFSQNEKMWTRIKKFYSQIYSKNLKEILEIMYR